MVFQMTKLAVLFAVIGIATGFSLSASRSSTRFLKLSMAFEFPSFDSVLQQFGGSTNTVQLPTVQKAVETAKIIELPIATAPVVKQVISVSPVEPATALSGGEFAVGFGLGVLPFILLPIVALNAVKGLIKAPKPLPVPIEPTTTVGAYTKSLREGLNEGVRELFSEQTADTELTKKGLKLSAAGFGTAIALTAVLFASNSATEASKVITKKSIAPAAVVKVVAPPAPAPVATSIATPAVVAPKVDIIEKAASEKAVSEKAASEKAASEKAASEKAASEKAASEKAASEKAASEKASSEKAASEKAVSEKAASEKAASEKAASEKAASEKAASEKAASEKAASEKAASEKAASEKASSEKAASEKAASEKAASEKAASEKAASEKAASVKAASEKAASAKPVAVPVQAEKKVVAEYIPVIPKGMESDKVDFEALKLLRKSKN